MKYSPICNLSNLRAFLEESGGFAKKGLSQNFLIDGNICRKIISTASAAKGDLILEIGPGPGALTEELLSRGCFVTAVEKDSLFFSQLERLQTNDSRLCSIEGDILEIDVASLFYKKGKVVSNLPYQITTPILTKLLPLRQTIETLTLMVQKEVGERLIATEKDKAYGSLSVFAQFYANIRTSFIVPPSCFYPMPKVDSMVLLFETKDPPSVSSIEHFFSITRTTFQQRRKMIKTSLKKIYPTVDIGSLLSSIGVKPEARPEEISLDQFVALELLLAPHIQK